MIFRAFGSGRCNQVLKILNFEAFASVQTFLLLVSIKNVIFFLPASLMPPSRAFQSSINRIPKIIPVLEKLFVQS